MKRILAACLEQTVHFRLSDGVSQCLGSKLVREEYEAYKQKLSRSGGKFRILDEKEQSDGSIIIKIKKQYNSTPCGEYFE